MHRSSASRERHVSIFPHQYIVLVFLFSFSFSCLSFASAKRHRPQRPAPTSTAGAWSSKHREPPVAAGPPATCSTTEIRQLRRGARGLAAPPEPLQQPGVLLAAPTTAGSSIAIIGLQHPAKPAMYAAFPATARSNAGRRSQRHRLPLL